MKLYCVTRTLIFASAIYCDEGNTSVPCALYIGTKNSFSKETCSRWGTFTGCGSVTWSLKLFEAGRAKFHRRVHTLYQRARSWGLAFPCAVKSEAVPSIRFSLKSKKIWLLYRLPYMVTDLKLLYSRTILSEWRDVRSSVFFSNACMAYTSEAAKLVELKGLTLMESSVRHLCLVSDFMDCSSALVISGAL